MESPDIQGPYYHLIILVLGHLKIVNWSDLRRSEAEDKNAGQNICNCSGHVPASEHFTTIFVGKFYYN